MSKLFIETRVLSNSFLSKNKNNYTSSQIQRVLIEITPEQIFYRYDDRLKTLPSKICIDIEVGIELHKWRKKNFLPNTRIINANTMKNITYSQNVGTNVLLPDRRSLSIFKISSVFSGGSLSFESASASRRYFKRPSDDTVPSGFFIDLNNFSICSLLIDILSDFFFFLMFVVMYRQNWTLKELCENNVIEIDYLAFFTFLPSNVFRITEAIIS